MAAGASFRTTVVPAALGRLRLYSLPRPSPLKPSSLFPFSTASVCMCVSAVEASKRGGPVGDDAVIKGVAAAVADKNVLQEVRHILEIARSASSRREILSTDFLTPPTLKAVLTALEKLADVKAIAQGGYPQAERCRLCIGHPDIMAIAPDTVSALRISGNFRFEPCSHGDFLGAILGTGILRDKIGDILLQGEKGAQVLVVPELVDDLRFSLNKHLLTIMLGLLTQVLWSNWERLCTKRQACDPVQLPQVGNVPVSCAEIPLLALEYEPPKTKSFRTVEASLRVDALSSAGFKISRTKLVDLISNGVVRVNWSTVTKNGTILKTGDVVSVSGKGRLKIGEIVTTRKGKYAIELIRYL